MDILKDDMVWYIINTRTIRVKVEWVRLFEVQLQQYEALLHFTAHSAPLHFTSVTIPKI
jgi:hypothetical protein